MEKKSFKRNPIYIQYEVRYSEYLLMKRIYNLCKCGLFLYKFINKNALQHKKGGGVTMRNLYKSKLSKSSEPTTYAICPCKGGCFFTCAGMCTGTCSGSCAGQSWKYGK